MCDYTTLWNIGSFWNNSIFVSPSVLACVHVQYLLRYIIMYRQACIFLVHLSMLPTDCWIWRTPCRLLLVDSCRWGWPSDGLVVWQGKPTQAMKEAEPLEYGQLTAKDYIPGAEILPETSEVEEPQEEQGDTTSIHVNCSFISTMDFFIICCLLELPSVLWHYWFGIRKSIWPVKT